MELTKLSKLKTNPKNPRTITDAQFERLKDSLLVFPKMLTLRPLATDGNGIVLGGNMRLRALKDIAKMTAEQIAERLQGMKTYNQKSEAEQTALVEYWRNWLTRKDVPTTHESTLTDAEKDEFVMTDNASFGSWDFDAIANEWDAELVEEWGVDVWQDVMSEDEENDNNFNYEATQPAHNVEEDDFDPEQVHETKVKRGEIWILGEHRLMCGDSTDADAVAKLMNGERADMSLTDPPYGVAVVQDNHVGADNVAKANTYAPIIGDETTDTARKSYDIMKDVSDNQIIFGGNYFTDFLSPKACWVVWDKKNTGNFADVELAWTSFDKGAKLYSWTWNGMIRQGDSDVELKKRIHPTQKPVGMLGAILQDFTKDGTIILDLFGGSGSTMIACEQLGRKCRMMELDPHYCTVIIARWEKFTGEKARKAE